MSALPSPESSSPETDYKPHLTKTDTNPIRSYRYSHEPIWTQAYLARKCKVTTQVIIRVEQGTLGMIPASIIREVARRTKVPEGELQETYYLWQSGKRYANKNFVVTRLKNSDHGEDEDFTLTMEAFRKLIGGSVAGFCKILCLHPSMWTRLETKGGNRSFLDDALNEMDLRWLIPHLA